MTEEQYIQHRLSLGGFSQDMIHVLVSAAHSVYGGMGDLYKIAEEVGRPNEHPKYPWDYYVSDSYERKSQILKSLGVCPECHGDQWVWDDRVCPGGGQRRKCPKCKGSGKYEDDSEPTDEGIEFLRKMIHGKFITDTDRLNWLMNTDAWFEDGPCDGKWTPKTWRTAIDEKMKQEEADWHSLCLKGNAKAGRSERPG